MMDSALNLGPVGTETGIHQSLVPDEYGSEEYTNRVPRQLEKDKPGVPIS